jgi:hypothetical protein
MASPDQPNSPSDGPTASHEDLEAIFAKWGEQRALPDEPEAAEEPRGLGRAPGRGWSLVQLGLSLAVLALLVWAMLDTRAEIAYWASDATPQDLGRIDERFKRGDHLEARTGSLGSNVYVKMAGLFATRELESVPGVVRTMRYFLCPTYDIMVVTEQPFPPKPERGVLSLTVEPEIAQLIMNRRASPEDLVSTFSGEGRLVRGDEAPAKVSRVLDAYAEALEVAPADLWVFLDGEDPGDYWPFALLWLGGPVMPLLSLGTWVLRRRRAAA